LAHFMHLLQYVLQHCCCLILVLIADSTTTCSHSASRCTSHSSSSKTYSSPGSIYDVCVSVRHELRVVRWCHWALAQRASERLVVAADGRKGSEYMLKYISRTLLTGWKPVASY
jgi:hypothetical protein